MLSDDPVDIYIFKKAFAQVEVAVTNCNFQLPKIIGLVRENFSVDL